MIDKPTWALRLQSEREARGWGKFEMARMLMRAVGIEHGSVRNLARQVSEWEKGRHFPRDWADAYVTAFESSWEYLFGRAACPQEQPLLRHGYALRMNVADDAPPLRSAIGHHGPVAPELVGYFRQQLPGHYAADMWLGPHMLIPTVDAQTRLIQQLVPAAGAPVRHGLLEMGVAYAALLGWLYQDAADLARSDQWRSVALDMAHRSGDSELISYALSNKAMHAVDCGDGAAVVDYAQAALADETRLSPKTRVLALVHLAHGYAFTRNREGADHALDRAEELIDRIDDDHPWGNACRRTPRYIDIQRATACGRSGHYTDATRLWDEILGDQPENFRRDTGVFWARQASALAGSRTPEPEKVVRIASIAASTCEETGSRRLRRELMAVPEHASAWTHSHHGRQLAEIIATVA